MNRSFIWIMAALVMLTISACGNRNDVESEPPGYMLKIKTARGELGPMEESLLPKVTEEYNIHVKSGTWPKWAASCLKYRAEFEEVERLTLYPAALVAGIAMHESAGCKMSAQDWAGGRGFMQLTNIDQRRHVDPIAKMLHVKRSQVDYLHNPTHNLLVGIAVLDDYERQLGSRPHGMLAYNMGVGGVKRTVRRMGYSTKNLPEILTMKPHLRYTRSMKPRVYVQKIIAAVIMMDKALSGEPIERQERTFKPRDVPGFDPADDGDVVLASYD